MSFDDGTPTQTDWSMIRCAVNADGENETDAIEALEQLARRYWPAVYAYIRNAGHDVHVAADLTQSFLCDVVLRRKLFHVANPARGRFRSLLLNSLRNYLAETERRLQSRRVVHERTVDPSAMDRARAAEQAGILHGPPETAFGMQWTAILIRDVLREVRDACHRDGLEPHWNVFEERVVRPIMHGGEPTPYHVLITRLEISDAAQAMNMMVTVKRRFARALHAAVRETVDDPINVDGELRALIEDLERQS
jgi:DNA-directed RNA polymerase specialized sigma24 family protein